MATPASVTGRASAILTTGEVFGADCDLSDSLDGKVAVDFSFTKGSLTNVIVKVYAGPAANPTDVLYVDSIEQTNTFTADTEACLTYDVAGARYFRISVTGTGTVTSSLCEFDYLYNDYEAATKVDGEIQIG